MKPEAAKDDHVGANAAKWASLQAGAAEEDRVDAGAAKKVVVGAEKAGDARLRATVPYKGCLAVEAESTGEVMK